MGSLALSSPFPSLPLHHFLAVSLLPHPSLSLSLCPSILASSSRFLYTDFSLRVHIFYMSTVVPSLLYLVFSLVLIPYSFRHCSSSSTSSYLNLRSHLRRARRKTTQVVNYKTPGRLITLIYGRPSRFMARGEVLRLPGVSVSELRTSKATHHLKRNCTYMWFLRLVLWRFLQALRY